MSTYKTSCKPLIKAVPLIIALANHNSVICGCFYFQLFPRLLLVSFFVLLLLLLLLLLLFLLPHNRQMSPLHLASDKGQLEILELLVKHGAKVGRDGNRWRERKG